MESADRSKEVDSYSFAANISSSIREGAAFTCLRYFDNALWLGGIGIGLYTQNKFSIPQEVVAAAVATGVFAADYAVSGKAIKTFGSESSMGDDESANKEKRINDLAKEMSALAYAAWGGSTSTVELNNSLGLESTRKRRALQAGIYGIAASLWTTDIPPFKQGREAALASFDYAVENPVESTAFAAAGSFAIFGLFKGIKAIRHKINGKHRRMTRE
jgi:hypothetical protein